MKIKDLGTEGITQGHVTFQVLLEGRWAGT